MSITFHCPHCQKAFKVEDRFAGRKAPCPNCKQSLVIPTTNGVAKSSADATNPASPSRQPAVPSPPPAAKTSPAPSKLPPPSKPAAPEHKPIEFHCPYCDEQVHVAFNLAGKQAPCPSCRRIIKVPMPVKEGPKDWRQTGPTLPSAARREVEVAPEGAWGTSATTSNVSADALLEAGAIPQERIPKTWKDWALRGLLASSLVLLLGGGFMLYQHNKVEHDKNEYLGKAVKFLNDEAKPKTSGGVAALHRGVGECYLRNGQLKLAKEQFQKALAALADADNLDVTERDFLLTDLAVTQIDMGGDKEEVDAGGKVKWEEMERLVGPTLRQVQTSEARVEAVRALVGRLIAKGQPTRAVKIARELSNTYGGDAPDVLVVVGAELLRGGQNEIALAQAKSLVNSNATPTLLALLLSLGMDEAAAGLAPWPKDPNDTQPDSAMRIGFTDGLYRRSGKWTFDDARTYASKTRSPRFKMRALVALAEAAAEKNQAKSAGEALDDAVTLLEAENGRGMSPWWLWRLVRVGVQSGETKHVQRFLDFMGDAPALTGRAQLLMLHSKLGVRKEKADDALADAVNPKTMSHPLAREALARHNERYSGSVGKAVEAWEEVWRPFGYVGLTLGLQDATLAK